MGADKKALVAQHREPRKLEHGQDLRFFLDSCMV